MTTLPQLWKRKKTGALQHWTVEIDTQRGVYRQHYGQVGGKTITTTWTTVNPTNIGQSNERDVSAQALFEAESLWNKKQQSGYTQSPVEVDGAVRQEPMLAKNYADVKSKLQYPVFCQPKLDGLRCVINRDGAWSRNGKPWVTIPHILQMLQPVFDKYPNLSLDGELYNHEYKDNFNEICSLVKRTKPSADDLQKSCDKVQFCCYDGFGDVLSDKTFRERCTFINDLLVDTLQISSSIVIVNTSEVTNQKSLDTVYENYLLAGFEGQMVRTDGLYEHKRSATLLKRKEFQDSEYLLVDICEGNGNKTGMAGYAILQKPDGVRFNSNIKGNHDYLKTLLKDRSKYVGKYATCKYFNLTPAGVPRFPYVIGFRDGLGVD